MPRSIVFGLFVMILVSPRMSDVVALSLAGLMLVSMVITACIDD
jgi:ABC-type phosphate transport system permease subunit